MAKRRASEEVELNLAAMLDMAFQILTFFILTFRPAPVEGQIQLRMPPPQALAVRDAKEQAGNNIANKNPVIGENTITVNLVASDGGGLRQVQIMGNDIDIDEKMTRFEAELKKLLTPPDMPYDQVVMQVDSKLRYEELMRALGVCSRLTVHGDPKEKLKLSVVDSENP